MKFLSLSKLHIVIQNFKLLIIFVTIVSAERNFSKLKLIETYLWSTISQERLSGLTILSIGNDMLKNIDVIFVIKNFAT